MAIDELVAQARLSNFLAELARAPRNPKVGYQGAAILESLGVFARYRGTDGRLYIADPAELVDSRPDLALREWITVRGDAAGGRESVKPGGGGLDVGQLIGVLGASNPLLGAGAGILAELRARLGR